MFYVQLKTSDHCYIFFKACRLIIGSFAYSANEMDFRWKTVGENRGVHMDYEAIRDLPQFELRHFEVINNSLMIRDSKLICKYFIENLL